jgi:hypothetical protein
MSKPFKETKLGQFLKDKAPHVLEVVGDVLPDKGLLGIVKNIIGNDPKVDPAVKLEFEKMYIDFEREIFALEVQEKASARDREVEFVKATGHMDYFMIIFGSVMLILFAFVTWASTTGMIPLDMREIFIESKAAVRDIIIMISGYYWGSSASSRIKDMKK